MGASADGQRAQGQGHSHPPAPSAGDAHSGDPLEDLPGLELPEDIQQNCRSCWMGRSCIAHAPKGDFDRRRIPANTQRKHIHGKAAAGEPSGSRLLSDAP